jgi:hypothetical protein
MPMHVDSTPPGPARLLADWTAANERAASILKSVSWGNLRGETLAALAAAEAEAASIALMFRAVEVR